MSEKEKYAVTIKIHTKGNGDKKFVRNEEAEVFVEQYRAEQKKLGKSTKISHSKVCELYEEFKARKNDE